MQTCKTKTNSSLFSLCDIYILYKDYHGCVILHKKKTREKNNKFILSFFFFNYICCVRSLAWFHALAWKKCHQIAHDGRGRARVGTPGLMRWLKTGARGARGSRACNEVESPVKEAHTPTLGVVHSPQTKVSCRRLIVVSIMCFLTRNHIILFSTIVTPFIIYYIS